MVPIYFPLFYGSTTSRVDCFGGGQFYCGACRGEGDLNAVARCRTLSHTVAKAHGGTWWNHDGEKAWD